MRLVVQGAAILSLVEFAALGFMAVRYVRRRRQEQQQTDAIQRIRAENARYLAASDRLLADVLAQPEPEPRVEESKDGVFVRASCDAEAAEIMWAKYLKMEKVA